MTSPVPAGYTADELERDNPHNQWMYETSDREDYGGDETDPDYEPGLCPTCNGSGEGRYEGTNCYACKGKGEL